MKTWSPAPLTTLLLLAGCGGSATTHESLAKEGTRLMQDFVGTLETIHDKASAEAARPRLEAIVKSMEELKKTADALGKPTPEQEQAMIVQMKALVEVSRRMQAWAEKMMSQPEAMAAIQDVMGRLGKPAGGR